MTGAELLGGGMPFDCSGGGAGLAYCDGLIEGNVIRGNAGYSLIWEFPAGSIHYSYQYGGGLFDCGGTIRGNLVVGNLVVGADGGGMANCDGLLYDNIVLDNEARNGGGIYGSSGIVENNVIVRNNATDGVGGGSQWAGVFRNNIVYWNTASTNPQMAPTELASYNCIQDWPTTAGLGNITSDPGFVDPANDDFHLRPDSPCIDAGGVASEVYIDFDGNPRPMDGVTDSPPRGDGSGWDIGAYEFPGPLLPLPSPPPEAIRDAILNRTPAREGMDLNLDGLVDAADVIPALSPGK